MPKGIKGFQIYCWFDEDLPTDMRIGELPKNVIIKMITNPK